MAKEKAKGGPQPAQRLPGAEDACISQEQLEIVEWYRKVKFRKNLLGGVDEVQMWKKLEELYGLYENAIRAERARYNALLEAHTPPLHPDPRGRRGRRRAALPPETEERRR